MAIGVSAAFENATFNKIAWRLIPLLCLGYIAGFLTRVNVGFAKLQMAGDLHFSDAVYGFGAGIFFIGYLCFEIPSNLVLERVGARAWLTRIMITWGTLSSAFLFVDDLHWGPIARAFGCTDVQFTFYLLRFLLGAAEAGFFPGLILYLTYWFPATRRAQMIALCISSTAVANVIGGPVSGAIMQYMNGFRGFRGWQLLFMLEGLPSLLVGFLFLALLSDGPRSSRWITEEERGLILQRVGEEEAGKRRAGTRSKVLETLSDIRLWALTLIYFCGIITFYAISFWMPTIIQELGIDQGDYFQVGLFSMIPYGVTVAVQVLWARHSDRTGERRWHSAGGLLVTFVGLLILAFAGHALGASIVALALVMAGTGCWAVTFWSLPTSFLSGTAAAFGIAWLNSVGSIGGYIGPEMIGRIRTATGGDNQAAFFVLSAAALVGGILTLMVGRPRPIGALPEKPLLKS